MSQTRLLLLLLLLLLVNLFSEVKADDSRKSRSYKCKHIGIQKIKNKKFKNKQDNKKKFKDRYETIKNTCEFIPVRTPRYAHN